MLWQLRLLGRYLDIHGKITSCFCSLSLMISRVHAKSYLAPHSASCRCKTEFTIIYILQQQPSTDQQQGPQLPLAYSWPVATPQPPQAATGFILLFYNVVCCSYELYPPCLWTRAWGKGYLEVPEDFTIMEKAPTRAFSWLKVPTSAYTFKDLLIHYVKQALIVNPR